MIAKAEMRAAKIAWVMSHKDHLKAVSAIGEFDPDKTYGGGGKWGDKLVPDKMLGHLDCAGIFFIHDGHFEIGGNYIDMLRYNKEMFGSLCEWINSRDWWAYGTNWFMKRLAIRQARIYFLAVDMLGSNFFNFNRRR